MATEHLLKRLGLEHLAEKEDRIAPALAKRHAQLTAELEKEASRHAARSTRPTPKP